MQGRGDWYTVHWIEHFNYSGKLFAQHISISCNRFQDHLEYSQFTEHVDKSGGKARDTKGMFFISLEKGIIIGKRRIQYHI